MQDSEDDIASLVANLAAWTRAGGACVVPIFMPERFVEREAQGRLQPGTTLDRPDGTRWRFAEPDGKVHTAVMAPPVAHMRALFEEHFERVQIDPYPDPPGVPMALLLARGPRNRRSGA